MIKDYEKTLEPYWQKGGTYVIPTGIVNDLLGELEDLESRNKHLLELQKDMDKQYEELEQELKEKLFIKNIYDFQDIVISALRYALGSRTYITKETADFIKEYPELITERVCIVMLRDVERYVNDRDNGLIVDDDCDYNTWIDLQNWLFKIAKEKNLNVVGYMRR